MARPRDSDSSFLAGPLLSKDEIRRCLGDLADELEIDRIDTIERVDPHRT